MFVVFESRFTTFVIVSFTCLTATVVPCGINSRMFKSDEPVAYNHLRITNDPVQVKPNVITSNNIFQWLNLKNVVRFKLWTRKNPELAHEIKYEDVDSLLTSNFNPKRLTKFLIHGFADSATEISITYYLIDLRDAYLKLGDVNVIIVDYTLFTMPLFYWTALPDVAGARLEEFVKFVMKHGGLQLDDVHFIGFSWGAHVAGLAGHSLNGKVGRITGLDPAGPTFRFVDNEFRLDKSDAKFVDIIHTNAGDRLFTGGHLGISISLGHVDVYPNGGQKQIGCPQTQPLVYETLECSHGRGVRYFHESISSPLAFPICKCETLDKFVRGKCPCNVKDMAFMGEHISRKARGVFQIITRSRKPFGHGPQMNVSLPDVVMSDKATDNLNQKDVLTSHENYNHNVTRVQAEDKDERKMSIIYKGVLTQMPTNKTYQSGFPLNDDIVRHCLQVVQTDNATFSFYNFSSLY